MSEQQIQKKILDWLASEGHYCFKVVAASKVGVPDIISCVRGRFIAFEVKKPTTKNNVSALQQYNIRKIEESGGGALVVWDVEQVKRFVNEAL